MKDESALLIVTTIAPLAFISIFSVPSAWASGPDDGVGIAVRPVKVWYESKMNLNGFMVDILPSRVGQELVFSDGYDLFVFDGMDLMWVDHINTLTTMADANHGTILARTERCRSSGWIEEIDRFAFVQSNGTVSIQVWVYRDLGDDEERETDGVESHRDKATCVVSGGQVDCGPRLLHGKGVLLLSDGARYEGSFVDGEFEGKGSLWTPDGRQIQGSWDNGHPDGCMEIRLEGKRLGEEKWEDGRLLRLGCGEGAIRPAAARPARRLSDQESRALAWGEFRSALVGGAVVLGQTAVTAMETIGPVEGGSGAGTVGEGGSGEIRVGFEFVGSLSNFVGWEGIKKFSISVNSAPCEYKEEGAVKASALITAPVGATAKICVELVLKSEPGRVYSGCVDELVDGGSSPDIVTIWLK